MNVLQFLLGALLIAVIVVDVLWTTVNVGGSGGPVTSRVTKAAWRRTLRLTSSHKLLEFWGITVVLGIIFLWLNGVWLGWSLVFLSDVDSVVSTSTGAPGNFWDKIYFAGYTVFTLGNGEFKPSGAPWQIATALTVGTGLFLVTLSISYLVPVLSAAVQKRQLGAYIFSMGKTPLEIVTKAHQQQDSVLFWQHLSTLTPMLTLLAQRHFAYPVLHYFHAPDREQANGPAIAALDEALTIMKHGLKGDNQIPGWMLLPAREAISNLLTTQAESFVEPDDEPPPPPELGRLREVGLETVSTEEFLDSVQQLRDRRRTLKALVEFDGWRWDDVRSGCSSRNPREDE